MTDAFAVQRMIFWTSVVSAQVGFRHHPGTTRDEAKPRSLLAIVDEADKLLEAFDAKFKPGEA